MVDRNLNFDKLEKCIRDNLNKLQKFRGRDIVTLSESDEPDIKTIFNEFLDALQIDIIKFSDSNKKKFTIENLKELLNEWNIKFSGNDIKSIYKYIKNDKKIKNVLSLSKPRGKIISK